MLELYLRNSREELACGRPARPRQRQEAGGGGKGKLSPRDSIPYCTANRPPVSNQRLPEVLDGRHPLGGSWLHTRWMHPTGVGGDWGWGCTRGEGAPVKILAASAAQAGKAQYTGATKSALLWRTRKLEPQATQGPLHIEQLGA